MAGYAEKTLAGGETILYRAHFNWTYSFFPVLWFALGCSAVLMYLYLQFGAGIPYEEIRAGWWLALFGFGCGALILLFHVIYLVTTEIVVTTYRFVFKRGLISRDTQEVSLNKIEEITLKQSVWGRVLGYGQLIIRGTGVGVITLPDLDNPIQVRRIIENSKADLRRSSIDDRRGEDD